MGCMLNEGITIAFLKNATNAQKCSMVKDKHWNMLGIISVKVIT